MTYAVEMQHKECTILKCSKNQPPATGRCIRTVAIFACFILQRPIKKNCIRFPLFHTYFHVHPTYSMARIYFTYQLVPQAGYEPHVSRLTWHLAKL